MGFEELGPGLLQGPADILCQFVDCFLGLAPHFYQDCFCIRSVGIPRVPHGLDSDSFLFKLHTQCIPPIVSCCRPTEESGPASALHALNMVRKHEVRLEAIYDSVVVPSQQYFHR